MPRNQLVDQPRERSLVMMMTLVMHQTTIWGTMNPTMKKNSTTMKAMTKMTQTMSMTMVNCQPVDLQDQERHGHHLPAVV